VLLLSSALKEKGWGEVDKHSGGHLNIRTRRRKHQKEETKAGKTGRMQTIRHILCDFLSSSSMSTWLLHGLEYFVRKEIKQCCKKRITDPEDLKTLSDNTSHS
jgi:hypothetical protein